MKIILVFIAAVLIGCKQKTINQRLVDYINNPTNKITQKIKIGEVGVEVKWLPYDVRRLMALDRKSADTDFLIDDAYNYFNVKFEKDRNEKPAREKVLYLDFDMQNDFVLQTKGDSLYPAICQKVENGRSWQYEYIVGFEKKDTQVKDDFTLVYKDKIFGIGTIAFVYQKKDIQKIPRLKS